MDTDMRNQKGYVIILALVCVAVFALTVLPFVNMLKVDSKHELTVLQFDENYFVAQSGLEIAHRYFTDSVSTTTYVHDNVSGNDLRSLTVMVNGIPVSVKLKDSFDQ